MKILDELFKKGRAASPPLSKKEVENLIISSTPMESQKVVKLKNIMFYALSTLAIGSLIFYFIDVEKAEPNNTPAFTAENKRPLKNSITKSFDKLKLKEKSSYKSKQQQKNKISFDKPQQPINLENANTIFNSNTTDINKNINDALIVEYALEPTSKLQAAIDSPPNKYATDKKQNFTIDSIVEPVEKKKKSVNKKRAKKHKSIHFIKADILGYFYNGVAQQLFFKTNRIDPSPLSGNRISLGYENLFLPKLSLGVTLSYGFSPFSVSEERRHNDSVVVEKFENYKGIMASLDARYYFTPKKGQGLYVGVSLGYGYLQERAFANNFLYHPNLNAATIITTRGHSFGLGLMAGYKYHVGRFYIEPNFSYSVFGVSSSYFDRGETKEEESTRYKALNRYEINIGYKF